MISSKWFHAASAAFIAVALMSCRTEPTVQAAPTNSTTSVSTNKYQHYQVRGVVKEIDQDRRSAVIRHEDIPGYMEAMTMSFDVRNTNELAGIKPGDTINFQLTVGEKDGWIENVQRGSLLLASQLPASAAWHPSPEVEPLKVGDIFPEHHFTNELGEAFSTAQYKGQALALTFFFTRCPYPTFCPLMSRNFSGVQSKLRAMSNAPTNWHLISISFDPEFDKPATLKDYAKRFDYNPERWSFATGSLGEITTIAEQVGEAFWHEGPSITHNLRTVVIDANGHVQAIIPENKWTSDELVAEIVKAAAVRHLGSL